MRICEPSQCTGCMACLNSCPHDAILERQNEKGFYAPFICEDKCVKCGLCQRVCPANTHNEAPNEAPTAPEVFACWNTDTEVRRHSTSGGMFTLFAEAILERGGVVFGVVFDPASGVVQHKKAETPEELRAMVGSKYVQSRISDTYCCVKAELSAGRPVLFTGTPCQCAGLKSFLRGEPENLYLIDLVCHGVPSPAVLKAYLAEISHGTPIKALSFREKQPSWELFSMKVSFDGRDEYLSDMYSDPYLRLFLGNYDLNDCCHECRYATPSRCGDVTLGDFWGYLSESRALRDNNKGINLVLVNTPKGRYLFEKVKHRAVCTAKTMDEAITGNSSLVCPSPYAEDRSTFWDDFLAQVSLEEITVLKKTHVRPSLKHRVKLILDRYCFMLPGCLKNRWRRIKQQNAEQKRNTFKK